MSGFPTLQPAFNIVLNVTTASPIGESPPPPSQQPTDTLQARSPPGPPSRTTSVAPPPLPTTTQTNPPQATNSGTLISVPGFTPAIHATVIFGADHLYIDPDGSKLRVNVSCIAK